MIANNKLEVLDHRYGFDDQIYFEYGVGAKKSHRQYIDILYLYELKSLV